ncbi:unnamed protein product [Cuscuta epithymum]|uniref:Uncharacterized protein n=1 Tax=Cuscuta epithymum TaxID=186058 RepID=A0AAV0GKZ2_9ASTE|nr:unnamed protein product [Cuscuta epithymum]
MHSMEALTRSGQIQPSAFHIWLECSEKATERSDVERQESFSPQASCAIAGSRDRDTRISSPSTSADFKLVHRGLLEILSDYLAGQFSELDGQRGQLSSNGQHVDFGKIEPSRTRVSWEVENTDRNVRPIFTISGFSINNWV